MAGVHIATVTRTSPTATSVRILGHGPHEYGPCPTLETVTGLGVGERVVVAPIGEGQDAYVILGRISPPPMTISSTAPDDPAVGHIWVDTT
jgi:hypothetical protein